MTPVLFGLALVATAVASLGAPLLPTIMSADRVSLAASQWALTISLMSGGVASPVLGRLGDGHRRRGVLLATAVCVAVGCVLSALPAGFGWLLAGRAMQGLGLALVPLAMAVARDSLPPERVRSAVAQLGTLTAVGIGIGYPVASVIVEYLGLGAAFWCGAGVSALAAAAAALVLPPSPGAAGAREGASDAPRPHAPRPHAPRPRASSRADVPGALLFTGAVAGLLLVLAQGQSWGWLSAPVLTAGVASAALLAIWVAAELRHRSPMVDVRLIRRPPVLAANATMLVVGAGIYPLLSLVVRLVQAPSGQGGGFGASVVVAGLMLAPFSLASYAANRFAAAFAAGRSPEVAVAGGCVILLTSMILFLLARGSLLSLAVIMGLAGLGVGAVFASNPIQITRGVPVEETGSAMGFYQVVRSVSFAVGSALSATLLVFHTPAGQEFPVSAGYSAAAWTGIAILGAALALAILLAWRQRPAGQAAPGA